MITILRSSCTVKTRSIFAALFIVLLTQGAIPSTAAIAATPIFHSVTFVENDSPSDPVYSIQSANVQTPLTSFASLNPSFVNSGFSFSDWNTAPDGSGTSYADESSYSFASPEVLYATWTRIFHSVTFVENDSASDPVYAVQSANASTALTAFAILSPPFSNPGFSFVEWNTESNGGGVIYGDGSTYSFSEPTDLYAIWSAIPTTVLSFDSNNGTGSIGSIANQVGGTTTLPSGSGMSNPGFTFAGWNTTADGSGTEYAVGATYVFSGNQTLYAQWTPDTYAVTYSYDGGVATLNSANFIVGTTALILPTPTFNGNIFNGWFSEVVGGTLIGGGGSSFVPTNSIQLFAQWTPTLIVVLTFSSNGGTGSIASLSGNDGATAFLPTSDGMTKLGYAFNGWNTQADGTGTQYAEGVGLTLTGSQTFYAQWTAGQSDTVTFNANGGSGSINPINGISGSTITLPGQSGLIHAGFALSNWNTSANGSGTSYSIGIGFKLAGSIILYAQWSGHEPVTLFGAIGTFKSGTSSLSAALKSQINRVALTIRARKYLKVDLYGYTAETGLKSLNLSLSRDRAINVAIYLRNRLHALKVRGVSISSSGQGSISGQSSNAYSRVEVFGV
jgi:uncharacterized repeat protein (TIGR02543 family)